MADVFVPDLRASLVLVSDLDDTAMDSETLSSWRMLRTALFRSAKRRYPVPGVPELYQALHRGLQGVSNPVCYISSGAWNLYDNVVDYLDTHRLPRGGMYLNDWGSRQRGFRAVAHSHKNTHVSSLMTRFPALPLLLVGDDTQEDPEIYAAAALGNPTRVAAIWIRKVRVDAARAASVGALQTSASAAGVEFVYASDTDVFAEHARLKGWIERSEGSR
jgi:phosphatidate phosphatase APP1